MANRRPSEISNISKIQAHREKRSLLTRRSNEIILFWSKTVPLDPSIPDFLQKMLNRRMFGHYRHETGNGIGSVGKAKDLRAIDLLKVKLDNYERTGNMEMLADIANYANIEMKNPKHPKAHYSQQDDGDWDRYSKRKK